jgi:Transcriptional regulatory protein, C terminal
MEIRILGPLEVMAEGNLVDLPAGKARLLLAALVVQANQVVSTDRLVEFLWHGQPPDSAANTLQTYVSHLRRSLEPARTPRQPSRLLVTREPGYLLAVDRDEIDAVRFERLVGRRGRSSTPHRSRRRRCCRPLCRCGVESRWPTSPSSRSLSPRSPGSPTCGSPPSKTASKPSLPWAGTPPCAASWHNS